MMRRRHAWFLVAAGFDTARRAVVLDGGDEIAYDDLIVATEGNKTGATKPEMAGVEGLCRSLVATDETHVVNRHQRAAATAGAGAPSASVFAISMSMIALANRWQWPPVRPVTRSPSITTSWSV